MSIVNESHDEIFRSLISLFLLSLAIICFVLLCTLISYSSAQPIFNSDEDDQMQVYDDIYNSPIPKNFYDYHQRQFWHLNKPQYRPDGLQLAKRIIMLPRVGRRSIRSTSE